MAGAKTLGILRNARNDMNRMTNVDVVVRAGQRRDFSLATWLLPFHATVGVDIRFSAFR